MALNAQLLRRVDLRPRPVSSDEGSAGGAERPRRLGVGGRLVALVFGPDLVLGAVSKVGEDGERRTGVPVHEEGVTVKGLASSEAGYTLEVLTPSLAPQAPSESQLRILGPDGVVVPTRRATSGPCT